MPVFADVDASTAALTTDSVDAVRTARDEGGGRRPPLRAPGRAAVDGPATSSRMRRRPTARVADHSRSAAVAYSFYPTKNLGGIGDGGAVVTADGEIADRVRLLRAHGMTAQYVHEAVSQNFRMSEIEAAWLRLALPALAGDNERRRAIAAHYRAAAPDLPWQAGHPRHVYHLCVLRVRRRP